MGGCFDAVVRQNLSRGAVRARGGSRRGCVLSARADCAIVKAVVFCYNPSIVSQEVARTAVVADRSPGIAVLPAGANCTVSLLVVGCHINTVVCQVLAVFTVSASGFASSAVLSTRTDRAVSLLVVGCHVNFVVCQVLAALAVSAGIYWSGRVLAACTDGTGRGLTSCVRFDEVFPCGTCRARCRRRATILTCAAARAGRGFAACVRVY